MSLRLSHTLASALCLVSSAAPAENASNPLAAVNNTNLRFQGTTADSSDTYDFYVDGAYMLMPQLKLKYELHYLLTDVTETQQFKHA